MEDLCATLVFGALVMAGIILSTLKKRVVLPALKYPKFWIFLGFIIEFVEK